MFPSVIRKERRTGSPSFRLTITYSQPGSRAWRTSVGDGQASVWVWEWKTPTSSSPFASAARRQRIRSRESTE
jgi:hypothetical protein